MYTEKYVCWRCLRTGNNTDSNNLVMFIRVAHCSHDIVLRDFRAC